MKRIPLGFILLSMYVYTIAQSNIQSNVYRGDHPGILYEGPNVPMKYMKLELVTLPAGKSIKHKTDGHEHVIISRSGTLQLRAGKLHHALTPGSAAVLTTNTAYILKNNSKDMEDWYYVFSYVAKDPTKGSDTANSFVRIWENIPFRPHERGGVRSYFDRPSSQTRRLEMHVTTLLAGLKSHDPHTHKAEEIILMIEGQSKMLIGDAYYEAKGGDVYYVESTLLHGIQNTGDTPCSYFAFQWE